MPHQLKTKKRMSKRNHFIFKGLHVVAWIIFVGLSIEAGALIVNFIFSIAKPDSVQNLYQKLDLSDTYSSNQAVFYGIYSYILFISILKAVLFFIVVRLMHKMDLSKPFSKYVSDQITNISYYTFSIGIISYIAQQSSTYWEHHGYASSKLNEFWADSQAFIIMAAVIYVIAIIFKKGLEIQNENDLTV